MAKPWIAQFGAGGLVQCADADIQPVGWVLGNVALAPVSVGVRADSGEVFSASEVAKKGWDMAMARMRKEAEDLGADGIVSIRQSKIYADAEGSLTDFCLTGTAVRGLRRSEIWTTSLNPKEISILLATGYAPVCLAMGCCTWHQSSYRWKPNLKGVLVGSSMWPNQEIHPATEAAYVARSIAMERVHQAAKAAGAGGVIGMQLKLKEAFSEGLMVGFVFGCEAMGLGIARYFGGRNLDLVPCVPLE